MNPICPICKWELEDDVYYQIKDEKIYPLEVIIDRVNIVPQKIFEDKEVFPALICLHQKWIEIHHCPLCDKDFNHYLKEI